MTAGCYRFDPFTLDPDDRQLCRAGKRVEINARYLDALALLVREGGRLVSKDRFMDEVWRGVPVTDEALTQCVRSLRRLLGDNAAAPRFIETVPKHGYRFIAPVEWQDGAPVPAEPASLPMPAPDAPRAPVPLPPGRWSRVLPIAAGATVGGGMAGFVGGLFYGFAGATQPLAPGMGAASVLLVLMCLTIAVAVVGGAGVGFGIAAAELANDKSRPWPVLGGAAGGLVVGGLVKLLGLDAFNLLFGVAPAGITGGVEGAILGGATGLGAWLASRGKIVPPLRRSVLLAGLAGGGAGLLITATGGRLMGGSLALLAEHFPQSRLRLDQVGVLVGEGGFGPAARSVTGALEGALFAGCLVGAMILARRSLGERR